MSILERLQPLQLNELPDINNVPSLSFEDEACLEELKAVLEKHNLVSKFGIALLHNHFLLEEGEALLEFCDVQNRKLISKPVRIESLADRDVIETIWRFDSNKGNPEKWCEKYCPRNQDGSHHGYKDHRPGED
jgi:hypothetical protein